MAASHSPAYGYCYEYQLQPAGARAHRHRFVNLSADEAQWQAGLTQAKQQCDAVADAIEARGYQVQSIRIVSNPFGEYLDVRGIDSALAGLQRIAETLKAINTGKRRIRFAVGEARNAQEVALLPQLIAAYGDLCNACVNIDLDEHGFLQTDLLAQRAGDSANRAHHAARRRQLQLHGQLQLRTRHSLFPGQLPPRQAPRRPGAGPGNARPHGG
jgi:hypothetical protein